MKRLKRRLIKTMHYLRKSNKKFQNSKKADAASLWLKDNFHIIENHWSMLQKEMQTYHPELSSSNIVNIVAELCTNGILPDDDKITAFLIKKNLTLSELQHLPFFVSVTLLFCIENGIKNSSEEVQNAVKSFQKSGDTDFGKILYETSETEKILCQDPAAIYRFMDEATKDLYRKAVINESEKSGKTESEIAVEALEKAKAQNSHIGFFLNIKKKDNKKGQLLISIEVILPLLVSVMISILCGKWYVFLLTFFPIWECLKFVSEFLSAKIREPQSLPRMDFSHGIPDNSKTVIAISTLLPSAEKANEIIPHLRDICLSSCRDKTVICILADLKSSRTPTLPSDENDINSMERTIEKLNKELNDKFILAIRPRVYSATENEYTGFERKRGAISALTRYISDGKSSFSLLSGAFEKLRDAQYIMTLDSDTDMPFNSLKELVSIAAHPLNKPVISINEQKVISGYGIIVPDTKVSVNSAKATHFSSVMAGSGGLSSYSTQTANRYQDFFDESIFSGKGLININAYNSLLTDRLPEQKILSHDILEGIILRTAFAGDVSVTESFPKNSFSYFSRLNRWIRGDIQNFSFLFRRKRTLPSGKLTLLGRYCLFDNVRRGITPIVSGLAVLLSPVIPSPAAKFIISAAFLSVMLPDFFSGFLTFINGGISMLSRLYFSDAVPYAFTCFLRGLMKGVMLLRYSQCCADAVFRAFFRLTLSHKHLLQWTTASQSDSDSNLNRIILRSMPSEVIGLIFLFSPLSVLKIPGTILLFDFFVEAVTARKKKISMHHLTEKERNKIFSYCSSMWRFYLRFSIREDNYLIPDNFQETPVYKIAHRTSPTNIGLMLCSFLGARDMEFISSETLMSMLSKSLTTVEKLQKYKGNLFNWYDTKTLKVMNPQYISTVDSGNFLCCLTALKEGLKEYFHECSGLREISNYCQTLIDNCELSFLYNKKRNLFHIGFDVLNGELSGSYYDLLMSEARMTSYFASCSGKVPFEHWRYPGRTLAKNGRYTGAISWTGTMFEYLMPAIFIPTYQNTLTWEAIKFCIYSQKKQVNKLKIPYGISESSYYAFDRELNYQYKALGANKLSLKPERTSDVVISPYSTFLTLPFDPHNGIKNLKNEEELGLYGKFGFFEAADFTKNRAVNSDFAIVRSYMAHHIGMSFLSGINAVKENIFTHRFMSDELMSGGKSLLTEKVPADVKIVKTKNLKGEFKRPEHSRNQKKENEDISPFSPSSAIYSNNSWSFFVSDSGMNISVYSGHSVFANSPFPLRDSCGLSSVVKTNSGIIPFTQFPLFYKKGVFTAIFNESSAEFKNSNSEAELTEKIWVHKKLSAQLFSFDIHNKTKHREKVSLMIYFEPSLLILSEKNAHPAFSKLFVSVSFDKEENIIFFTRNTLAENEQLYIAAGFTDLNPFTFSTDREAVLPYGEGIKGLFSKDYPLNTISADKCVAIKCDMEIKPGASASRILIFSSGSDKEEAKENIIRIRRENCYLQPKQNMALFSRDAISGIYVEKIISRYFFGGKFPYAPTDNECSMADLWESGVSGDYPIILVLNEKDSDEIILPFVHLHEQLKMSGITTELVFLTNKNIGYYNNIRDAIKTNSHFSEEIIGQRGGIFIVNATSVSRKCIEMLRTLTCAVYPETNEIEINYIFEPKKLFHFIGEKRGNNRFKENGYLISERTYLPYCHIIANNTFGTLVSESSLGFTWALNSRENKLTPWVNDTRTPYGGELLFVKDNDMYVDIIKGSKAYFEDGKANWTGNYKNLSFKTDVMLHGKAMCKNVSVKITNNSEDMAEFTLNYYVLPVIADSFSQQTPIIYKKNKNGITVRNPLNKPYEGYLLLGAEGDFSVSTDVSELYCSGIIYTDNGVIISKKIILPPKNDITVKLYLAFSKTKQSVIKMPFIIPSEKSVNKIEILTPDSNLNNIFNNFLHTQIIDGRLKGRTGFYQCSGAYGFRDQLQDASAVVMTHPEIIKIQIFRCASAQFKEGDVLHWFHTMYLNNKYVLRGVRTRCSDDLLWLPLAVSEYCFKTGDFSILKQKVPYIEAPVLEQGESERFGEFTLSKNCESLYCHCMRAVIRACNFGTHELPLIRGGDWNDSFNLVGIAEKGESVWLGMFLSYVLKKFSAVCVYMKDDNGYGKLNVIADRIISAIDEFAWNEDRYLRCFYDDGSPMGKKGNKSCEIDLLPQAWSVLSGMPDIERCKTAVHTADKNLIDRENGLIKLFSPPFSVNSKKTGYVNIYPEGIRENGGQYTHGAAWLAQAFFRIGEPNKGLELINILNPANKEKSTLKTEPYYLPGDVYSAKGMEGRGGWSIYTGSAGWFYRTIYEDMLGIKQIGGRTEIKPCLPDGFGKSRVKITINSVTSEFIL